MDFPDQLIDAHGAGELVVFAGAGVSMPLPTGLPSFKALAVQVGNEAGLPLGRFDQLDAYLGRVSGLVNSSTWAPIWPEPAATAPGRQPRFGLPNAATPCDRVDQ
jgi:hypothetical protein